MSETEGPNWDYPMRLTTHIPLKLYTLFTEAIGTRAMRIVGENHKGTDRVVSSTEDARAIRQAKQEALREAIEDWIRKQKSGKWLDVALDTETVHVIDAMTLHEVPQTEHGYKVGGVIEQAHDEAES